MEALEAVHSIGRTYNDLKLDNVIVERSGKATLIDFGLCKKFIDSQGKHVSEDAESESFEGNVMFSSPHTLNFGVASRRDDLYQLCYILLYLLNGHKFPGHLEQELEKVRNSMEKRMQVSYQFKKGHSLTRLAKMV